MYRVAKASALGLLLFAGVTTPLRAQLGGLLKKAAKKADSIAAQKLGGPDSSATVQKVGGSAATPGSGGMWLNYDFVTGDNVLFTDNFQAPDRVGDFPKRLDFKEGNMEIAESGGARFLRLSSSTGSFNIVLPQQLPQHFTLEFDFMPQPGYGQEIRFTDDRPASQPPFGVVTVECYEPQQCDGGIRTAAAWSKAVAPDAFTHQLIRVSVLADGKYAKVYLNGTRVANVPNADLGRSNHIVFDLHGDSKNPTLVGPITVAGGGRALYDALETSGRVSTHGILFDVGSDHIKAESGPTLKEIAAMLAEHPALKLTIEGHTDDQGDAAQNLTLSERRAAAVKQALVDSFKADAARLATKGLGSTKPVKSNGTPEGRQQNRRVELVRP
jgi:outer membrane protein OmpA-like peptidoglycan-associated protein